MDTGGLMTRLAAHPLQTLAGLLFLVIAPAMDNDLDVAGVEERV